MSLDSCQSLHMNRRLPSNTTRHLPFLPSSPRMVCFWGRMEKKSLDIFSLTLVIFASGENDKRFLFFVDSVTRCLEFLPNTCLWQRLGHSEVAHEPFGAYLYSSGNRQSSIVNRHRRWCYYPLDHYYGIPTAALSVYHHLENVVALRLPP